MAANDPHDEETTVSTLSSDGEAEAILREVAHAPPRRPPTSAVAGTRWSESGRYVIEQLLGRGGMGTVYKAIDTTLNRPVALKVLDAVDADHDSAHHARLLHEAQLAASVEHERIARVYDVGRHKGFAFVAMELVHGETLRQWMAGRVPNANHILDIATQIAEGLAELHANRVVHRDLKPENVMRTAKGGIKLVDFGLARHAVVPVGRPDVNGAVAISVGTSVAAAGTPGYMAPEQCEGKPVDARADIFALGVIIYELVTGKHPFRGTNARATMTATLDESPVFGEDVWARVPERLRTDTARMLARDPEARFSDGGHVLAALRDIDTATSDVRTTLPAAIAHVLGHAATVNVAPLSLRSHWRAGVAVAAVTIVGIAAVVVGRTVARDRAYARALAAPPPQGMVLVRGGTMKMGATADEVEAQCAEVGSKCDRARLMWSTPSRRTTVEPFYMDILEVTNAEMVEMLNGLRGSLLVVRDEESRVPRYVRFNEGLGHDGRVLLDLFDSTTGVKYVSNVPASAETYHARPGREHWPATQVTLFGARRFCASRGKRLPTEDEWEAAARGTDDRKYPWGDAPVRCGGVRVAPDGNVQTEPRCPPTPMPTDVGTSPQDVTPDGVFDLGGNVGEWTDTVFNGHSPIAGDAADDLRPHVTRGGSFAISLAARTSVRSRQPPTGAGINGGFRCALSLSALQSRR